MTNIERLLTITSLLRDKEHGCSWDLKQTFQSITPHTLEEVYEVIDCIEQEDYEHLPNELGDLLFQVVLYAQMGKEANLFDFNDVLEEICEKLLTRHPHVFPDATIESFGNKNALTPDEVEVRWEEIKAQEGMNKKKNLSKISALDDIPYAFPALLRAKKLQKKASNVGFDWAEIKPVIDKVKEEITELEEAIAESNSSHIEDEFGDVMFSMVNLSRHLKIDTEGCLRSANHKFENRFRLMEDLVKYDGKVFSELDLQELEHYWEKAKLALKQGN